MRLLPKRRAMASKHGLLTCNHWRRQLNGCGGRSGKAASNNNILVFTTRQAASRLQQQSRTCNRSQHNSALPQSDQQIAPRQCTSHQCELKSWIYNTDPASKPLICHRAAGRPTPPEMAAPSTACTRRRRVARDTPCSSASNPQGDTGSTVAHAAAPVTDEIQRILELPLVLLVLHALKLICRRTPGRHRAYRGTCSRGREDVIAPAAAPKCCSEGTHTVLQRASHCCCSSSVVPNISGIRCDAGHPRRWRPPACGLVEHHNVQPARLALF